MEYQSKYCNIDTYYAHWAKDLGWDKEEFVSVIEQLENMGRDALLSLCKMPELSFAIPHSDWEKTVPESEIVTTILSSCHAQNMMEAIKKSAAGV